MLGVIATLSACLDPYQSCNEEGFQYETQGMEQCVIGKQEAKKELARRIAAASASLSQGPNSYGSNVISGASSALTLSRTSLCPLSFDNGHLIGDTVSGMNKICYYR